MRRLFFSRKGQSTLDYALLIAAVCVGLVLAARGMQGMLKSRADEIGSQYDVEHGRGYSVRYSESDTKEEIADTFTKVDINKQLSGSKEQTKTPDVGATEDIAEIDKTDFNPWQSDWDAGITW